MTDQGDLALLDDPVAQEMLGSTQPARLAYVWPDGTPRVVPMWFHWDGRVVSVDTPPGAPKLRALETGTQVAVTIDDASAWPYKALLIRGRTTVEMLDGVSPQYVAAARRYMGDEQAKAWVEPLRGRPSAHVTIEPSWVAVLDFVTRFPSALSS